MELITETRIAGPGFLIAEVTWWGVLLAIGAFLYVWAAVYVYAKAAEETLTKDNLKKTIRKTSQFVSELKEEWHDGKRK
jgi:uncharacterized membrane protein (DUF485 family)